MSLDTNAARPLTSREIAKLVSGLLGGLSTFCSPQAIADALDHFHQHRDEYMAAWAVGYAAEPDTLPSDPRPQG